MQRWRNVRKVWPLFTEKTTTLIRCCPVKINKSFTKLLQRAERCNARKLYSCQAAENVAKKCAFQRKRTMDPLKEFLLLYLCSSWLFAKVKKGIKAFDFQYFKTLSNGWLVKPRINNREFKYDLMKLCGHLNASNNLILVILLLLVFFFQRQKIQCTSFKGSGEHFFCKMFTIYECWIISSMNSQVRKVWCRLRGEVKIKIV